MLSRILRWRRQRDDHADRAPTTTDVLEPDWDRPLVCRHPHPPPATHWADEPTMLLPTARLLTRGAEHRAEVADRRHR